MDQMLLTDLWEALDYTNEEPPIHLIMRPVAQFFGYSFDKKDRQPRSEDDSEEALTVKRPPNPSELSAFMLHSGKPQPAPKYVKNLKTLNDLFDQLKKEEAERHAG